MNNQFIHRELYSEIIRLSAYFPVIVLTGPRQSGKTTLCKNLFPAYRYVDVSDAVIRNEIAVSPKHFLAQYANGLIIDEAQTEINSEEKIIRNFRNIEFE